MSEEVKNINELKEGMISDDDLESVAGGRFRISEVFGSKIDKSKDTKIKKISGDLNMKA